MEHITITATQQGASYITEFVITEIETPTQSLNPSSALLTAEFFLDSGFSIKIGESSPPETPFSFSKDSPEEYTLYCRVIGPSDAAVDSLEVNVLDYKPVFSLVSYECKTINEATNFELNITEFNELNVCEGSLDPLVQWKVYFGEELLSTVTNEIADVDDIDVDDLKLTYTFTKVGKYLITCTVQNCNTFVTKSLEVIVCGDIKFRKIDCETVRIYNPKNNNSVSYTLKTLDEVVISTGTIPALSFIEIKIQEGIFQLLAGTATTFVINWCSIENCYIDILKNYLCQDCDDCDDCNKKKESFERRYTSIYQIYKKLVDTSEIYEVLYSNTDINGKLEEMYAANELGKYLVSLCDCHNKDKNPCGC